MDDKPRIEPDESMETLLDRLSKGEEVTITRNGEPVARLVATSTAFDAEDALRAVEDMIRLRQDISLGDGVTFKDLIGEGRRY